jgi:hypothetical protein
MELKRSNVDPSWLRKLEAGRVPSDVMRGQMAAIDPPVI